MQLKSFPLYITLPLPLITIRRSPHNLLVRSKRYSKERKKRLLTMGEKGHVKVFGMWASPIAIRVEWALKLKGVEYEYVDEDLGNKSEDLLRHNPVTKKVPVLVHDGKPLAESLVILEYIDEVWKEGYYPIMPDDPYERARVRFWAKYADDKVCA